MNHHVLHFQGHVHVVPCNIYRRLRVEYAPSCPSPRCRTPSLPPPSTSVSQWLCPCCTSRTLPSRKCKLSNVAGGAKSGPRASNGVHVIANGSAPRASVRNQRGRSSSQRTTENGGFNVTVTGEKTRSGSPASPPPASDGNGAESERES